MTVHNLTAHHAGSPLGASSEYPRHRRSSSANPPSSRAWPLGGPRDPDHERGENNAPLPAQSAAESRRLMGPPLAHPHRTSQVPEGAARASRPRPSLRRLRQPQQAATSAPRDPNHGPAALPVVPQPRDPAQPVQRQPPAARMTGGTQILAAASTNMQPVGREKNSAAVGGRPNFSSGHTQTCSQSTARAGIFLRGPEPQSPRACVESALNASKSALKAPQSRLISTGERNGDSRYGEAGSAGNLDRPLGRKEQDDD